MGKKRYSQGERIARIIHLLTTKGSKSYPELEEKFSVFSKDTLERDIKLLKKTGLVIDKKEPRNIKGKNTRKVFIFFKDDQDIVGKTKRAMEDLKRTYTQVTLDLIASHTGFPPEKIQDAAYTLAPELELLIGREVTKAPPPPLMV